MKYAIPLLFLLVPGAASSAESQAEPAPPAMLAPVVNPNYINYDPIFFCVNGNVIYSIGSVISDGELICCRAFDGVSSQHPIPAQWKLAKGLQSGC